jgi:hypothetical protein
VIERRRCPVAEDRLVHRGMSAGERQRGRAERLADAQILEIGAAEFERRHAPKDRRPVGDQS